MELFTFEYLLLAAFLIIFKAVPDGLMMRRDNLSDVVLVTKKKQRLRYWADSMYFAYHAVISLMLILSLTDYCNFTNWILQYPNHLYKIIVGFLLFRFGIFDPILNLSAGEPLNYVGFTKRWDKIIRGICMEWKWIPAWNKKDKWHMIALRCPVEFLLFIRLCTFLCGIAWLITANRP